MVTSERYSKTEILKSAREKPLSRAAVQMLLLDMGAP